MRIKDHKPKALLAQTGVANFRNSWSSASMEIVSLNFVFSTLSEQRRPLLITTFICMNSMFEGNISSLLWYVTRIHPVSVRLMIIFIHRVDVNILSQVSDSLVNGLPQHARQPIVRPSKDLRFSFNIGEDKKI